MHERTDSLSPYYPFHVTAATTGTAPVGARPLGNNVTTTSATTIVAGSDVVVTPATVTHMQVGMQLNVSGGTGTAEDVRVKTLNVSAGTFTADFKNGHSGAYLLISMRAQYLGTLVINAVGTITGINIYNGSPLLYNQGSGAGGLIASIGTPSATQPPYLYNCYCDRGVFYTQIGAGSVTYMVTDDNVG